MPICWVTAFVSISQAQAEKFDETLKTSPDDRDALEVRFCAGVEAASESLKVHKPIFCNI